MAKNEWITGVISSLIGVITLFRTGRDPPCNFDTRTGERSHLPPNQTGSHRVNLVPFILIGKWLVTSIYLPFKPFGRVTTLFRGLTDHGCQLRPFFFHGPSQWNIYASRLATRRPLSYRSSFTWPVVAAEDSPWWGPIIQERDFFGNQKNILNCISAVELYPYNPWDWSIYLKISHKNQRFMWVNIPGTIDCLG